MARRTDPLAVVARVRRIRERDSLLGLLQARAEREQATYRHEAVVARLVDDRRPSTAGTAVGLADFAADRLALTELELHGTRLRHAVGSAEVIETTSRTHWQQDRVRLEAIEMLLERRAAVRTAERVAHETRELDDIALQTWVRRDVRGADA